MLDNVLSEKQLRRPGERRGRVYPPLVARNCPFSPDEFNHSGASPGGDVRFGILVIDRQTPVRYRHKELWVMRKALVVGATLAGLAGCNTAPISYLATSPQPEDATYACVLRKVNELGYTIQNTNKEAGFVAGEKQTSGLGTAILTGRQYHDILTVSIFDDGKGGKTVRATTGQSNESAFNFGAASKTGQKPSNTGKKDAKEVLSACTQGAVTEQASTERFRAQAAVAP